MPYILILSFALLFCACQKPQSTEPSVGTRENPNSGIVQLDSSKKETLIKELSKILNEQPDGISVSGLLMKQEKGSDNNSRLTILTDSGSIITIPYHPPLSTEEVRRFARPGNEVSLKYTTNNKGDTTVVYFTGNNK